MGRLVGRFKRDNATRDDSDERAQGGDGEFWETGRYHNRDKSGWFIISGRWNDLYEYAGISLGGKQSAHFSGGLTAIRSDWSSVSLFKLDRWRESESHLCCAGK